jgi:hypothetical protein
MNRDTLIEKITAIVGPENIVTEMEDLITYFLMRDPRRQLTEFQSKHLPIVAVQPLPRSRLRRSCAVAHDKRLPRHPPVPGLGTGENTRSHEENTIILSIGPVQEAGDRSRTLPPRWGPGVVTAVNQEGRGQTRPAVSPVPASFTY